MTTTTAPIVATATASVLELRHYTLHPGQRDALIRLFEREFVESQQACGMTLPGLFTDMDRPDRFIWLRGFADMAARPGALTRFYTGPAWQAHRNEANATMVDSDNVLLLQPRGPATATSAATGAGALFVLVDLRFAQGHADVAALDAVDEVVTARLSGDIVGRWTTDPTPNNFPRLPVREGERHAVWLARLPRDLDAAARAALVAALAPFGSAELLRLQPTPRSELQLDAGAPRFVGRPGDFDFLVGGRWEVKNRRLMTRLRGNTTDWREFTALSEAWTHMNGQVSFEEIRFESEGFSGATLRTLDMQTKQWAIYWINSRSGKVFPPVYGGWCGDRGEFFGIDEDDGRTVLVRFLWERLGPDTARWTQAFSLDGGRAWEDNWTMELTRI